MGSKPQSNANIRPMPPTLGAARGPRGEIIVTKSYQNFPYSMTMRNDGAIVVKPGDWLSKYSAAMYNDFAHVREFARMDRSGVLRPIHNVDLIFAGETIYHIPTYKKANPLRMDPVEIKASPLSEEEEKKIIVETLKQDYGLHGEALQVLEEAAHIVHGAETAVEIAQIAGWIAEGTAAAAAGEVLALVSAVLTPVMIGIAILNANDTDRKLAGMQAIGYTLTAWAFDHPIPGFPKSLKTNYSYFPGRHALPRVEQAWKEAAEATIRNLEAEWARKRRSKKSYQDFWRAIGGNDPRKLVRRLMEARAAKLWSVEKASFLALDPEGYPN